MGLSKRETQECYTVVPTLTVFFAQHTVPFIISDMLMRSYESCSESSEFGGKDTLSRNV